MNAIIMAAGRGARISRFIQNRPKCAVPLKNTTLIEYTVSLLRKKRIHDISVVIGYGADYLRSLLKKTGVKFYDNPFFNITNSVASLWFACRELGKGDTLIMNGDVLFEDRFLDVLLKETRSPVLFSDESRKKDADYKLYYKNNILKKYGKQLPDREITGEYVGVAKLNRADSQKLRMKVEEFIDSQKHGVWWEEALYPIAKTIHVRNVEGIFWTEVDLAEDLKRLQDWAKANDI